MTERELDSLSSVDLTVLCSVGLTSQAHSDGRTAVRLSCPDRWNESLAIVLANDDACLLFPAQTLCSTALLRREMPNSLLRCVVFRAL